MKRILSSVLFIVLTSIASAASLQKAADRLIDQVDPAINIGVSVVDLNTGDTIYQRNPMRSFIPASNMKLFSDAAALMALGPDYRYKSQLSTNALMIENGVLKGSLYLHLPGDPSFNQDDLSSLLASLKSLGIKQIQGNIILLSQNRYITPQAPGWMVEDLKHSYGAPIAPLILDENRLTVTVNPAHKPGLPALVETNNPSGNWLINNQVKTKPNARSCGVDFSMDRENRLTVRGCVGVGQWAVQQRIPIRNPLRYAQTLIRQKLLDIHIKLDGEVILGNSPGNLLLLSSHRSKPIAQLMADTLKPSDNLYADSLFLHAAAKLNGTPLNWKLAQETVKTFLQKQTGINLENAVLTDGSGLSRYDQLTPQQTVGLLRYLHDRFPLTYEYIAALPIAGHDGTLQRRFRKPGQQGFIRAKTGYMTGVVSLSGYLYTANAHTLAFAIFINGMPGTSPRISGRYRYLVDALCDHFLKQKPKHHFIQLAKNPHLRVAYQNNPLQSEVKRSKEARWRGLESTLKHELTGVAIIFRGDELILNDYNKDIHTVWSSLQTVRKKYPFGVLLESAQIPNSQGNLPLMLWIKKSQASDNPYRVWKVRETVS
ncbi:D-alanyl-D-alanine carboxypeptidase/D-alanyl-D-alanine endopeptidase [Legionella impletisoli]|uniref:D-alanyl-D-alanine carboxypeptidase n=1 Tax=Legionella impletisoli TaxID=343510 RepID=A0A917NDZ7_9GAMM|nr:D-alanyl-D-alanine carboxypeptidase/D-alanyl-D-alanine-endopeptidase [Legionella impletisoli]GGI88559.1 D-alanyl-D-alanine carboxypeptidase [Legionella impletisoli]